MTVILCRCSDSFCSDSFFSDSFFSDSFCSSTDRTGVS